MASAERGVNTTVVVCGNGAGEYIPPFFIFRKKGKSPDFLRGAVCGSECFMEPSGWMTYGRYVEWLKFFIKRLF